MPKSINSAVGSFLAEHLNTFIALLIGIVLLMAWLGLRRAYSDAGAAAPAQTDKHGSK